jgi:hypothetical protein
MGNRPEGLMRKVEEEGDEETWKEERMPKYNQYVLIGKLHHKTQEASY